MVDLSTISIIRSNRRSIALHVTKEGEIIVRAPYLIPKFIIKQFMNKHIEWIEKQYEQSKKTTIQKENNEYLYLGKKLSFTPGNYSSIKIIENKLLFPQGLLFRKEKELKKWYIQQAKENITNHVITFSNQMKTNYKSVTFSDTRSQWGRCTHDNRLQFSWRLIMAPQLVINYVVIHELAHTMEKNHTQLFWMKVRNINPSFKQQIKWLKENGKFIHSII